MASYLHYAISLVAASAIPKHSIKNNPQVKQPYER